MLKELSKYDNLGTPGYHFELLKILRDNPDGNWRVADILELFHNRVVDGRYLFDGCLPLLNYIGIIQIGKGEAIIAEASFLGFLTTENLMIDRLLERLLSALSTDSIFHEIFCSEFISYDIIYRSIQIDNAAFPLKYAGFKQLLIDFKFLQEHPTKELKKFIINKKYKGLFDKVVLPEIRKRKIGINELQKVLEEKRLHGEEAERFVLKFEKDRLNNLMEINWVAEYSVSEGYDIASYDSELSKDYDRFIEVKSYSGNPYFFWSRNEMDTARIKRANYYLYLIDRDKMHGPGYKPIIIQDPYHNILNDDLQWEQQIEKIRVSYKR